VFCRLEANHQIVISSFDPMSEEKMSARSNGMSSDAMKSFFNDIQLMHLFSMLAHIVSQVMLSKMSIGV